MKKALFKVTYRCNNRCIYCHAENHRHRPEAPAAEFEARIRAASALGAEMAVFSGGEPTLHEGILDLARVARACGMQTGLITNGRRFVYPAFGAELVKLGLRFAYVSFHSADPAEHALTTNEACLPQTLAALENLVKLGVEVTVNTVVTRLNLDGLTAVADRLAALGPAKIKFSAVEPKGAALADPRAVPPLGDAAEAINRVLRHGRARYPDIPFGCEGLTPCLLDEYDSYNDDLLTNDFILIQEAFEASPSPPDYANRSKPRSCLDCAHWGRCPGVFTGYLSQNPLPPLRPEIGPRSNSFVFLKSGPRLPVPISRSSCPARTAGPRRIFLAAGSRLHPYETPTSDFTDSEISETLAARRVYAAPSSRPSDADHGRGLRRLEPAPLCRSCPERAECSRLYARARKGGTPGIDGRLRKLARGLRGDVLEVGCGNVRLRADLARRAAAGIIRYLGIDTAPPAGAAGGLRVLRADIESFDAPNEAYDHVLLIGSYNHIRRPSAAFSNIRRLLRPRGILTVADSAPFGVVLPRPPAPAEPGRFEHFRNHDSARAESLLSRLGFFPEPGVSRGDLPGECDWLLRMRKT